MYQPDGTMPLRRGTSTVTPPVRPRIGSSTERWSTSRTWVTALGRTSRTLAIRAASGVPNCTVVPRTTDAGPPVIAGRSPLNRYGGL